MVRRFISSVMITLSVACTAAPKPADTAADEQAIREIVTAWNGYLTSQNDSAITAIYASDAVIMPPNAPAVRGAAGIRQFWASLWPIKAELGITPTGIMVHGDVAIEEGTWTLHIPGPDAPVSDNGKYIVVWHRQSDGWKAIRDIYNSDNAPPAPAK
jgi:ketosteroid isomerase-like protein